MLDDVSEDIEGARDQPPSIAIREGKGLSGRRHRMEVDDLSSTRSAEFILAVFTRKVRSCRKESSWEGSDAGESEQR